MTRAEDYIRAGQLDEALKSLEEQIRKEPANAKLRIFLFQLLCVMGNWNRAVTQLNVIKEMDAGAILMAQVCSPAIQCEALRAEIFAGNTTPVVFGKPAGWVGLMIQANELLAKGKIEESNAVREKALEVAPASAGKLEHNGQTHQFEWLADADSRLGPILEAIIEGRYFWVPLDHIRSIKIEKPEDLRDMVWAPATFTWTNGGSGVGLIPVRYAGSESSAEAAIRLARRTDWDQRAENVYTGLGQRILATDQGEYPLLEIRQINFTRAESDASG